MTQGTTTVTLTGTPLALNQLLSIQGRTLLKRLEGIRLKPYDDQTGRDITQWVEGATIGVGHLIDKSEWSMYAAGVTQQGAETLLAQDVTPFERVVRRHIHQHLSKSQFDALVIFSFNIGVSAFSQSSVVKLINNPRTQSGYHSLESAWKAWDRSQGRVMEGLKRRRTAEWKLFNQGVYQ